MKHLSFILDTLEILFSVLVILCFRTVWMYTGGSRFSHVIMLSSLTVGIILSVAYILFTNPIYSKRDFQLFLILSLCDFALTVVDVLRTSSTKAVFPNVFFVSVLFLTLTATRSSRLMNLLTAFIRTVCMLAAYSLIFWTLAVFHFPTNSVLFENWATPYFSPIMGYFKIYYLAQGYNQFLGMTLPRNTAIFTEAPMFAFVLCLALIMYVFIVKGEVQQHLDVPQILIILGVFSTGSTTGLVIVLLTVALSHFKQTQISPKGVLLSLIVILISAFFIVKVFEYKALVNGASVDTRSDDLQAGLRAWLLHPIIGNGLSDQRVYMQFIDSARLLPGGNAGYSSGLLQVLFSGGIAYLGLTYGLPMVTISLKERAYMYLVFLYILLLVNTVIFPTFLFYYVSAIFYALVSDAEIRPSQRKNGVSVGFR